MAAAAEDHLDDMELDATRETSQEGAGNVGLKRKSGSQVSMDSAPADDSVHSRRSGRGSRSNLAGLVETRKLRVDNLKVSFCHTDTLSSFRGTPCWLH